jgi:preprotein translocase subunit YajC
VYSLLHILAAWYQPEASSGSAPVGGKGPSGGGGLNGNLSSFGMLAMMMVVFYLVAIRPQQKKQKEHDNLLKSLKKGQKVRTTGGLRGEIADFKNEHGEEVVLLVADKVKLNVLRSQIASLVESAEEKKSAETDKKS